MLASIAARRLVSSRAVVARVAFHAMRSFGTGSVTYSGGQPTEGQGGFYGSGGARVISSSEVDSEGRQKVLAFAADVEMISAVMDELYALESELREQGADSVSKKSLELKSSIKKLMTAPEVSEALDRLEIQGEPVWGLSTDEREMIVLAREKMNEC
mmetsp:Transcript_7785/g.15090  ORF Transcript_7785/g.15090 Transcript_7785/m.15090 type:complete len:157 (-) Transcript_7785:125-595(-)|eukprot:scaffold1536_cov166-Amphora_coffeaeformis.AAC.5